MKTKIEANCKYHHNKTMMIDYKTMLYYLKIAA